MAKFEPLRKELVRAYLPGTTITLAQNVYRAELRSSKFKASDNCSDVKQLVDNGFLIIDNGVLHLSQYAKELCSFNEPVGGVVKRKKTSFVRRCYTHGRLADN
jgi:hypothetical protein